MKYEKMPEAEPCDDDDKAMLADIASLREAGADVRRPVRAKYQLKVASDVSYYPSTGVIVIDGEAKSFPYRGMDALLALLRTRGEID